MASRAGARWLGLVGPMPSGPGVLTLPEARSITEALAGEALPGGARLILLTAAETANGVVADAATAGVDAVQVVQHITLAEAGRLAAAPLHYIQVVHVEDESAVPLALSYARFADALLLDSGRPSAAVLGGTGARHDWSISRRIVAESPIPVFLAGGLEPGNVAEAIAAVGPAGLDLCSGLRPGPDRALDAGLLAAFMAAVAGGGVAPPQEPTVQGESAR
ncbi:MAG: phosphoribosylanthranilate isomerase [Pseudomonadota bacterium]